MLLSIIENNDIPNDIFLRVRERECKYTFKLHTYTHLLNMHTYLCIAAAKVRMFFSLQK